MKVKIGDLTRIKTGKLDANASSEEGKYPFFTCSRETLKIDNYSYDCECVLIAGNGDLNVKYYKGKFDAYQRTYIIEDNSSGKLYMPYLYYFMEAYVEELRKQAIGGVIKYIKMGNLTDAMIELPSIEEQKKIVNTLENIRKILNLRNEEILKLDNLIKARFVEMSGNPRINPRQYPVSELSEYIEFLTSGSRGWAKYCIDDGTEWFITIKNVKDCRISVENMQSVNAPNNAEARRTKVQEGDLLISITADLGRTGVVTKEIAEHGTYINQHLICIRLNKAILNPLYVAYFMESTAGKEQFESKNQSAVKAGLNFNSINSLRIMVPPISIQEEFVSFVKQVDKSKFVERFLELSLFYRLFSPLDSEMICIFPYFCPYAESAREIREIFV